jgi:glycosyltransferase involved in cell wall biosynthesis
MLWSDAIPPATTIAVAPAANQVKPEPTIRHHTTSPDAAASPAPQASNRKAGLVRRSGSGVTASHHMAVMDRLFPSVSVVIPAKDSARTVGAAVSSALAQEYPGSIEVVVADGGGEDGTGATAAAAGATVVPNPAGTTPAGLNAAIGASSGDVVVRCDAHAILPSGYVRRAVETLERTGAGTVGGMQIPAGSTFWERAVGYAMSSPLGAGDARYRIGGGEGPVDTVYLGVFRREVLERVGGFDETLERNQDYELNWRIRQAGRVVWFDPELRVPYRPRGSIRALWRQYGDYGRWKREVIRRHPGSLRPRQLAAPVLVVVLSLSGLASFAWRPALLLPGAYVAAIFAAGGYEAIRRRDGAGLGSSVALMTMHLSWGLGFLLDQTRRR